MNFKIEEAKKEFDDKNFEKALEILNGIEGDEEYLKLVFVLKIACLRSLKRFGEALRVINLAIEKYPYDDFFWSRKVECHYFNDENDDAVKSLGELERIIDKDDKHALVRLSCLFKLVGDDNNALKYCDMALSIDEDFREAIRQKGMIASSLKDYDMMSDCADRLVELNDADLIKVMVPLMLKLFSKRYRDALGIVNGIDEIDEKHCVMLKTVIYNVMCEDLGVELKTSAPIEMAIEEGLDLLFEYHYDGVAMGTVRGVTYIISKSK